MKHKFGSAFTMIEMAIVLVIIGVIAGILMPAIFSGIEKEKIFTGKNALTDFKEQIIGYAVDAKVLPPPTDPIVQQRDVWVHDYVYVPVASPNLTLLNICDQTAFPGTGTLQVVTRHGDTVPDVAFLVASFGPDGTNSTNYTVLPVDLQNAGDDFAEYVTFYELYRRVCTPGQTSSGSPPNPPEGQITFDDGMSGFINPVGYLTGGSDSPVVVIKKGSGGSGGTVELGGNTSVQDSAGCLWYEGNSTLICADGNCTFGTGLRAYFEFEFSPTADADGFTFSVISAATNNASSCGGPLNNTSSRGELMGYAGPGRDGRGIQYPKMAMEFDIWYNQAGNPCDVNSRNDASNQADHLAFLYWGTPNIICTGDTTGTIDDNVHGSGDGTSSQPTNSEDGMTGYYYRTTTDPWLEDGGLWRFRMEIERNRTETASQSYQYNLRAWLKSSAGSADFTDMSKDYNATSDAPDVTSNVELAEALHDQMHSVLFGWTQGTGGATQMVTISNFKMSFRQ